MLDMSESILTTMYSWLTPTVLFVFLNLMIGTIAITSSLSSKSNNDSTNQSQIQRSPSVIHRLKSLNFSSFTSPDKTHLEFPQTTPDNSEPTSIEQNQSFLTRSPSVLHRIKSFNLYNYISQEPITVVQESPPSPPQELKTEEEEEETETSPSLEEVYSQLNLNHVARTKSDTEPASGIIPPKLPKKMKKSASTKSPFSHFEEDEIAAVEARRPETVRVKRVTKIEEEDEEVDAKADDFINRFKHQLKLQRIDSIAKYKDMVKKRNEK